VTLDEDVEQQLRQRMCERGEGFNTAISPRCRSSTARTCARSATTFGRFSGVRWIEPSVDAG
jgi:hypothetical protein